MGPEEVFAVNDLLIVFSAYQTTNVRARLNALRQPKPDGQATVGHQSLLFATSQNLNNYLEPTGIGASSDFISRAGGFVNGNVSFESIDGNQLQ